MKKFLSLLLLTSLVAPLNATNRKPTQTAPGDKKQSTVTTNNDKKQSAPKGSGWCVECNKPNSACGR